MHQGKTSSSDSKEYPPDSLMGRLKERKIIATLEVFVDSADPRFKKLMERVKHEWENFEV
jgi:hypothetical protein